MDIFNPKKRSEIMSGIKSKNTKPEVEVRKWLHSEGFRFRIHKRDLPGCPDIVLKKHNTIILVNGCFFHHHQNCKLAYVPKTRTEWWLAKFSDNKKRDEKNIWGLRELGWEVLVIWECQVRDGTFKKILKNHFPEET